MSSPTVYMGTSYRNKIGHYMRRMHALTALVTGKYECNWEKGWEPNSLISTNLDSLCLKSFLTDVLQNSMFMNII
jgi:hypothetical protein